MVCLVDQRPKNGNLWYSKVLMLLLPLLGGSNVEEHKPKGIHKNVDAVDAAAVLDWTVKRRCH